MLDVDGLHWHQGSVHEATSLNATSCTGEACPCLDSVPTPIQNVHFVDKFMFNLTILASEAFLTTSSLAGVALALTRPSP